VTAARCSDASAEAGEPLAGTAVHVENWLLVELRGTWPRDVADVLAAGGPGANAIRDWLEVTPASRLLFVRRPGSPAGVCVFVVRAASDEASVRRFALADIGELDVVDLERGGEKTGTSLVLVCGHGTRDACCALRGNAVHGALAPHAGADELWISTHQAGHRFAANVLLLPSGIQLGRVSAENAGQLVADARRGKIAVGHYRGRTAYPPHVQAADIAVRTETGLDQLDDLALVSDDGERVTLVARGGPTYTVAVERVDGPVVPASCGAEPEPQPVLSTRLV
jgi:hypothetical protein